MENTKSAFEKLPGDDTLAVAVRDLQVALQAELLRAGALWEESLSILRTLGDARSSRYRHAARHLLECQAIAAEIRDFGGVETHEDYRARLEAEHGRKTSFWSLLD